MIENSHDGVRSLGSTNNRFVYTPASSADKPINVTDKITYKFNNVPRILDDKWIVNMRPLFNDVTISAALSHKKWSKPVGIEEYKEPAKPTYDHIFNDVSIKDPLGRTWDARLLNVPVPKIIRSLTRAMEQLPTLGIPIVCEDDPQPTDPWGNPVKTGTVWINKSTASTWIKTSDGYVKYL